MRRIKRTNTLSTKGVTQPIYKVTDDCISSRRMAVLAAAAAAMAAESGGVREGVYHYYRVSDP